MFWAFNLLISFKYSKLLKVGIIIENINYFNKISKTKAKDLLKTLKSFKLLMSVNKVDKYKICATSAMRESSNSKKIINTIYEKLGLKINVIPGKEEAAMIANVFAKDFNNYNNLLYVDVGGGSTELTIINKGKIILDHKIHNFIINISDVNHNTIQVQGVLKGKITNNANVSLNIKNIKS